MFWWVSHDSATVKTVGTICVRFEHRMHETVRTNFLQIFSQRMCPNHLILPKTLGLMRLSRFHHYENRMYELGLSLAPDAWNCANKLSGDFVATNVLNPLYLTQNLCFHAFRVTLPLWNQQAQARSGSCIECMKPCERSVWRFFFRNKNTQSSSLVTRLMFWCISHDFTTLKTVGTN